MGKKPLYTMKFDVFVWQGNTEKQITQKLFDATNAEDVGKSYQKLDKVMNAIIKSKTVEINSVNRVYVEKSSKLLDAYLKSVKKYYSSEPKFADFKNNPEKGRTEINSFVAEKTKDMIEELLPGGTIKKSTRLVLVNALYFKGGWELPFKKAKKARKWNFHVTEKKRIKADMMSVKNKTAQFHMVVLDKSANVIPNAIDGPEIREGLDYAATALRMPYKGGKMDMVIVLPENSKDLSGLEKRIYEKDNFFAMTPSNWGGLRRVVVSIPKFMISSDLKLKDPLQQMGMGDVFTKGVADLSGMLEESLKGDLYVSDVIQKCVIKVNEEGSEAAAATAVAMAKFKSFTKKLRFRADKPFLFFIVEKSSGMILFSGRMVDPSKAKYED